MRWAEFLRDMIVWAVKPQMFQNRPAWRWNAGQLHLSVMTGIPSAACRATGNVSAWCAPCQLTRPGQQGHDRLFARPPPCLRPGRQWATDIIASTGATRWLDSGASSTP